MDQLETTIRMNFPDDWEAFTLLDSKVSNAQIPIGNQIGVARSRTTDPKNQLFLKIISVLLDFLHSENLILCGGTSAAVRLHS
jgi:hypothetical protein